MHKSSRTVASYLKRTAESLGPLHRLKAGEQHTQVFLDLDGRGGPISLVLTNHSPKPLGTYLPLHDAVEKFAGFRLSDRQHLAGLNVDGLGIVVTDDFLHTAGAASPCEQRVVVREQTSSLAHLGHRSIEIDGPKELVDGELLRAVRDTVEAATAQRAGPHASVRDRALASLSTWEFRSSEFLYALSNYVVPLVGQCYRPAADQAVLAYKGIGNLVLLVREPDNAFDRDAVMVLMWNNPASRWHHVGYVRADFAAVLSRGWHPNPGVVALANISSIPVGATGHRCDPQIKLVVSGATRFYPGFSN